MASEGDDVKKLKRENRKLREQLELKQSEIETLTQRNAELIENCKIMEAIIKDLYKEVVIDFDRFRLCVSEKCIEFASYNELLTGLKIVKLFL